MERLHLHLCLPVMRHLWLWCGFCLAFACFISGAIAQDKTLSAQNDNAQWEGIWFSCEHAQRQRAPDDNCQMFDDEGFSYHNGTLSYLRMTGAKQDGCKGNKIGHCFRRDSNAITVQSKNIGDVRIENDRLIVRYWGCEQSYYLSTGTDYMTVKPVDKNCFWSQERHFYIAPFMGQVSFKKK